MYTVKHRLIEAKAGERVQITFTVTDNSGASVSMTGATATFKIARSAGDQALLTKTEVDGISFAGNTAIVNFDTGDVQEDGQQAIGKFFDQMKITKSGIDLVVSEGYLTIGTVIQ